MNNTLHEAIIEVLDSNKNNFMTYEEIADKIKQRNLWRRKKDFQHPPSYQIKLRANNKHYQKLFIIEKNQLKLRK